MAAAGRRRLIALKKIRELDLEAGAHLSAASGLVRAGDSLYVVADDELHLGVFQVGRAAPGRLLRVFEGELPDEPAERKARKPDLEAIALLPHGVLLAVGSASKKNRCKGVLLELDTQGGVSAIPHECDLRGIVAALEDRIPSPNFEGAFVTGREFCILQRANQRKRENAILRYELPLFLDAIRRGASLAPTGISPLELGSIDGVALGLTDGAALSDGRFVFSAVAEDTADSYQDGRCAGAVLGIANLDGRVDLLRRLDHPHKIEGVEVSEKRGALRLLLVTDADDRAAPASLYTTTISAV